MGYFIKCQHTYEIDGTTIWKGTVKYHSSKRPVMNPDWKRLTAQEAREHVLSIGLDPEAFSCTKERENHNGERNQVRNIL